MGYANGELKPGTEVGIIVRESGEPVPATVMKELLDKKTPHIIDGRHYARPVSHYHK